LKLSVVVKFDKLDHYQTIFLLVLPRHDAAEGDRASQAVRRETSRGFHAAIQAGDSDNDAMKALQWGFS
jgi:hypothetical protein